MGKTFAMDVSARLLTGLGAGQKVNQLIDVRALLHYAAHTTLPVTIEDNESSSKVNIYCQIPHFLQKNKIS